MDDVMVRSRYPRHSIPAKRRSRYGRDKSKLPALIIKQFAASVVLLLAILLIKSVNTPFTNYISDRIHYVLEQNIKLDSVFSSVDNALGKLRAKNIQDGDKDSGENTDNTENIENTDNVSTEPGAVVNEVDTDSSDPETSVLSASTENGSDFAVGMITPISGVLSSSFGQRKDPTTGKLKQHEGIDIEAEKGKDILAALAGIVVYTGNSKSYGEYVRIRHDERFETLYAHCSTISVVQGQKVAQGDAVAKVGNTGISTGTHLHFEVWKDSKVVNPLEYVSVPLP